MKHAYLVMAHKNDYTLQTLLKLLDDERNDIFIHMDLKCKNYDPQTSESIVKMSGVYHTKRINVKWGGYSQIEAELILMQTACGLNSYEYYHLISGEDLPIKSQDAIHTFFDRNKNKEFIRFQQEKFTFYERVAYYYIFTERSRMKFSLQRIFLIIQKGIGIKRNKAINFMKGTNWFSITDDLLKFILKRRKWIKKTFKYTYCCDEVFLQTLVFNSRYRENLYHIHLDNDAHSIMRFIDWSRGNPYVFRISDFYEIMNSDLLFARKFNEKIDKDIIKCIYDTIQVNIT